MILAVLSAISLGILCWCIWTRRRTWGVKWERATTLQITMMAVGLVLDPEPPNVPGINLLNPVLHRLTHIWNLQCLVGHLLLVGATSLLVYNAVSRLDRPGKCPDETLKSWFQKWIQVPTAAGSLLITALFLGSRAVNAEDQNIGQHKPIGPYVNAYWIVLSLLVLYLLIQAARAYIDLWDEQGRSVLSIYLAGCVFSAVAVILRIMQVLTWSKTMNTVMFGFVCLAVASFSLGAGWSWLKRVHWFKTSPALNSWPPPLAPPKVNGGDDGQTV